jgi:hypothetical protein
MTYKITEPFAGAVHTIEATDAIAAVRAVLLAHGAPSSIGDADRAIRTWLTVEVQA